MLNQLVEKLIFLELKCLVSTKHNSRICIGNKLNGLKIFLNVLARLENILYY